MPNDKKTTAPIGTQYEIKKGVPLKNMLNADSLKAGALVLKSMYSSFDVDDFLTSTMDEQWNDLELKQRGRQITLNLGKQLPTNFREAISILNKVIDLEKSDCYCVGLSFPDFVEVYGQEEENWEVSIKALETYTHYWSSEFAVRPFIIKHEQRMMKQMYQWSLHESEHVRRLSSEGCRPSLPWAQALNNLKGDPTLILPILKQLKEDPSMYVRKSVANNLNDISKTRPDLVVKLAQEWYGNNIDTNWIVKHGCRTLLKKGNREVLSLFGFHDSLELQVENFTLDKTSLIIGETLTFSFLIHTKQETKLRLEYGIDYVKSNGKTSRKIFQISESLLKQQQTKEYRKSHSFANVSIRKHYPGVHSIVLIVNGAEKDALEFALIA